LDPVKGLHNGEDIHIVATGLTLGARYYAQECETQVDDADLGYWDSAGFAFLTADASGTVTTNYYALEGPFGAHDVTCGRPGSCQIVVWPDDEKNYEQLIFANLDFA
jgi:hypothetical protein